MTGARVRDVLARAGGVLLAAVPFLPLGALFGRPVGDPGWVPPQEWLLGLAIFVPVAWLVAMAWGGGPPRAPRWLTGGGESGRAVTAVAFVVLAAVLLAVSRFVFDGSPLHVDSVTQLFQAKIFAAGGLHAPAPADPAFFETLHMVLGEERWYSQYPPGHPALLAAGVLGGAPWLVPVLLTLGTAAMLVGFSRRAFGPACSRLTALLVLLCPFLWFMGASFMNHVTALFFVSAALYAFARWEEEGATRWAVASGAALGAAALARPLTGAAAAAAFALWIAIGVRPGPARGRRWRSLLTGAATFAAVASLYLVYNAGTTGHAWTPGYLELWGGSHGLGFHATPWGGEHTPVAGLRNELLDLSLLNLYLFEWPIPALLPVGLVFGAGWASDTWSRRLLGGVLALPAAYLFYWHRDSFLGPRFLYAGLAFVLPLTAAALSRAGRELSGRSVQAGSLFRPVDLGRTGLVLLGLCFGYAALYGIPRRFEAHTTGRSSLRTDLAEEARRAGVGRGLIFVKVSWGNRILARLRGGGVPAGTALRAYRSTGHCALDRLATRAVREPGRPRGLTEAVERLAARDVPLVQTAEVNGDPTLRLRRGRELPPRCREEIRYDRSGYTNYAPHLTVNRPDLGGRLVVARDLRSLDRRLRRRYPDREAYLFDGRALRPLEATPSTDTVRAPAGEARRGPEAAPESPSDARPAGRSP